VTQNGCLHTHTRTERQGNDSVMICEACGNEVSRSVDHYGEDDE
jgi:hypothetical protein